MASQKDAYVLTIDPVSKQWYGALMHVAHEIGLPTLEAHF